MFFCVLASLAAVNAFDPQPPAPWSANEMNVDAAVPLELLKYDMEVMMMLAMDVCQISKSCKY